MGSTTRRLRIITAQEQLITETCCNCGILFAFPEDMHKRALRDHSIDFYCPNGHGQHYTGPTEAQKLKEQLQREQDNATYLRSRVDRAEAEADHQRSRAAGFKGALTKTRKRIAGGVCPCCNRSFVDLARHMKGQHPDFAAPEEDSGV